MYRLRYLDKRLVILVVILLVVLIGCVGVLASSLNSKSNTDIVTDVKYETKSNLIIIRNVEDIYNSLLTEELDSTTMKLNSSKDVLIISKAEGEKLFIEYSTYYDCITVKFSMEDNKVPDKIFYNIEYDDLNLLIDDLVYYINSYPVNEDRVVKLITNEEGDISLEIIK